MKCQALELFVWAFYGGIIIGLIWEILAYDEILPTSRSWVMAKKLWWIAIVGLPVMVSIMNGNFPNLFFLLGLGIVRFNLTIIFLRALQHWAPKNGKNVTL